MTTLHLPLAVFYRPEMSVSTESFSPSSRKPQAVVEDWLARKLPIQVHSFEPVSPATLAAYAHDKHYVEGVLAGEIDNGFENRDPAVAQACLYTCGSLFAAARYALGSPDGVACSPSSGFHHAHWDHGGGYCTFNGLAMTALALASMGKKVTILDCDVHFGDGTADILNRSTKRGNKHGITYYTVGGFLERGPDFMFSLQRALENIATSGTDIVLYQAGADMHEDDPLGGFLSTAAMRGRDRRVFRETGRAGIAVAWNLAGGYQRDENGSIAPVLALHGGTLDELVGCDYGPTSRATLRSLANGAGE